jgi:MFS family permease
MEVEKFYDHSNESVQAPPPSVCNPAPSNTQAAPTTSDNDQEPTHTKTFDPPPNGGLLAWLHVLAGFMLFFNTWGLLNTFAFFQLYYESGALFTESSSNISWIGSIQAYLVMLVGMLSGPIFDRGHIRFLLITGAFGIFFGLMMLSICNTYWQVLLTQGFVVGAGAGCLFVPCVSILPTYFSTRIGLAIGLAVSGSSLGGVIYPIILFKLVGQIGFRRAVRVVAFITLGTLLIPIAVMRLRVRAAKPRQLVDFSAFKDVPFMIFTVSTLLSFVGLAAALFYIPFYAQEQRILDSDLSFYSVAIYNAASCLGRTLPNILSDKIGPFNVLAPCTIITGILLFGLIAVSHEGAMIGVTVLTGFFSGVLISLPPICFNALTEDKGLLGSRIGMGFGIVGFGLLIGGPGAGSILGTTEPLNWSGLWAFAGVMTCIAGAVYIGLRLSRSDLTVVAKA